MSVHPYRTAQTTSPPRPQRNGWAIAVGASWVAAVAFAIASVLDHSLAGPLTGLAMALAVGIPVIAIHARVLAGGDD